MPLTEVSNTTSDISELVVRIVVTYTNGVTETGSGILLDGRTVLTAAHCVDDYYRLSSGVFVQGVIATISVIPAFDDTPPSGGSQSPHGQYFGDTTSVQIWPGYNPSIASSANSALDLAIFELSGSGVPSSSIAVSQYIAPAAFYGIDAADNWNVAMMGFPADAPYDGGNMFLTNGVTASVGLPSPLVGLVGSTAFGGQSGGGMIANIDNDASLHTGDRLQNSFIAGVMNAATDVSHIGVGAYLTRAHLDWILANVNSVGAASELQFLYHFGSDGGDAINATPRRDYMLGGDGVDTLSGGDADDILYGEADNDTLTGGIGNDFLDGGAGANTLDGGAGSEILVGAAALAACASNDNPETGAPSGDGLARLQADNLTRIVHGHGLAWGHDSIDTTRHRIVELFCRDGRWFKLGGAELVSGRYTLSPSALCVQTGLGGGNQSCRAVFRDSSGSLFTLDLQGSGEDPPYPVTSYDYAGGQQRLCGE